MKYIVLTLLTALSFTANAAPAADIAKAKSIIKNGNEPALYVKAFEARGLQCDPIKDDGIKLGKIDKNDIAKATVVVFCNEYDKEGNPQANVYFLKFEGHVYVGAGFYNIDNMTILPQE